jgi:hypothetical protein
MLEGSLLVRQINENSGEKNGSRSREKQDIGTGKFREELKGRHIYIYI